jgi:hypothetical protein
MPHDSKDLPPQEEVRKLVAYTSNKGLELLLTCDADCCHEVWGSADINVRVESRLDFIMSSKLCILNRGRELTFMDPRRWEVLDITLCTEGVMRLVRYWRVSNEPLKSDHRQIRFGLNQTYVEYKWSRKPGLTFWTG